MSFRYRVHYIEFWLYTKLFVI